MTPTSFEITGLAVCIGRVGPVVVHPRIQRPERRGETLSGIARPMVARETPRGYWIRTTGRSCLSGWLELCRHAFERRKSACGSFEVCRDEELLGCRQS